MSVQQNGPGGEEWGPWVVHDGKGCPLSVGIIVEVVAVDGFGFAKRFRATVSGGEKTSWDWSQYPELNKIIRYRIRKPKALQLLQSLLEELPAPEIKKPVNTH